MKWYWVVIWCRPTNTADGDDTGQIKSQPFATEDQALTNLQARLNQPVPDISLPRGAYVVSYSVELKL